MTYVLIIPLVGNIFKSWLELWQKKDHLRNDQTIKQWIINHAQKLMTHVIHSNLVENIFNCYLHLEYVGRKTINMMSDGRWNGILLVDIWSDEHASTASILDIFYSTLKQDYHNANERGRKRTIRSKSHYSEISVAFIGKIHIIPGEDRSKRISF